MTRTAPARPGSGAPEPAFTRPARTPAGWLLRAAALATLYMLGGWAGLQLAPPPGYTTPIWPASGIALALLLLWGGRVWPGVWIGAFVFNLWTAPAATPVLFAVAAAIATAASVQALVGAALVRRFVSAPMLLESGGDVWRFILLAGLLSCTIAAATATAAFYLTGRLAASELGLHGLTWWVGDAVGVLLVAPLVLVLGGGNGAIWRSRFWAVALTVLLTLAVAALVVQQTNRFESRRIAADFGEHAGSFGRALDETLAEASAAINTLADYFRASSFVEPEQFERFARGQLERAHGIETLAWLPRVEADALLRHEQEIAADGGYRVFEFSAGGQRQPPGVRAQYFPVAYVSPFGRNADAWGFDVSSERARAQMLEAARADGALRASRGLPLIAGRGQGVLAAVHVLSEQGEGFVMGVIVLDRLMKHVLAEHSAFEGLTFALIDAGDVEGRDTLYAIDGSDRTALLRWNARHEFGGRRWELRVTAGEAYLRAHRSLQAWFTEVGVLLFSALLSGFLLTLTGKSARIEQLVARRTAELEDKNRALAVDIDRRRQAEHRLRLSAEVFEHLGEAIMITDADNRIVSVNRAFSQITGYAEDEVIGRNPSMLSSGRHDKAFYEQLWRELGETGVWRGEVWDRRKNGECYPEWLNISLVRDAQGKVSHHVAVFSDISERKASEERIRYLAQVDALTNLPNRYLLADRLQQATEAAHRSGEKFAVMFVDIDRFKNINDSLGHGVGDVLLRETAARLRGAVRASDTVARQGGDEFVIVMPHVLDAEQVAHVARKLLEAVARPFRIEQHLLSTTASIGVAMYPADGSDPESLMKHADAAMYAAKNSGRNGFRFFTSDMNARVQEFLRIENDLRSALERGELRLHYQPQYDAFSGEVVAAEALVRWQHPERGLMLPSQFIHVAEESGLVERIGEWVLGEACRQNRAWQARGLKCVPVSVNLSAAELHRAATVRMVEQALQASGLAAQWLELEVTESMLMRDVEHVRTVLQQLRDMGVLIALDDFGTGYSSLAHLRRFPLSALKVDRSFVRDIETDANDAAICRAVIALGKTLGLRVIAEGVENGAQLEFLRRNRCDAVQGALFSWGVPPEEMALFLQPALVQPAVAGGALL